MKLFPMMLVIALAKQAMKVKVKIILYVLTNIELQARGSTLAHVACFTTSEFITLPEQDRVCKISWSKNRLLNAVTIRHDFAANNKLFCHFSLVGNVSNLRCYSYCVGSTWPVHWVFTDTERLVSLSDKEYLTWMCGWEHVPVRQSRASVVMFVECIWGLMKRP